MDVWRWVMDSHRELKRAGQHRLAQLLVEIPGHVTDDEHGLVDATVPEALALAKGSPWLEVFFRHWHLQSRVLHRHDTTDGLPDAVRLVELASRPEARDCPQSVCATQDLVACYGAMDGPGYAPERIAASEETLARIDPSWPCWACISGERVDALVDDGRAEEAARVGREAAEAMERAGLETDNLARPWGRALLACGRAEEALAQARRPREDGGRHAVHEHATLAAQALVALGRHAEAAETLPPVEVVRSTPSLTRDWVAAARSLALAGALPNDAALEAALGGLARDLGRRGCTRAVVETAMARVELAVARGAVFTARDALAQAEQARAGLRGRHLPELAPLRAAVAAQPEPTPPRSADDALGELGQGPEIDEAICRQARALWPERAPLLHLHLRALLALDRPDEAIAEARAWLAEGREARVGRIALLRTLLRAGRPAEARAELARMREALPEDPELPRLEAHLANVEGDEAAEAAALERALGDGPRDQALSLRLAELRRAAGDAAGAVAALDAALESSTRPRELHWARVVAASIAEDWAKVRASGIALGMPLEPGEPVLTTRGSAAEELANLLASGGGPLPGEPRSGEPGCASAASDAQKQRADPGGHARVGEAPVDERWGVVLLRWSGEDAPRDLGALRTGPATARVLGVSGPRGVERCGDLVVFEPRLLNPDKAEDDLPLFPVVHTLRRVARRSGLVDLLHPGAERRDTLLTLLEEGALGAQRWREEGYTLPDAEGRPVPGLLVAVALGEEDDVGALHAALSAWAAEAGVPAVWPEIAELAGDLPALARQRELAARHTLWWPGMDEHGEEEEEEMGEEGEE